PELTQVAAGGERVALAGEHHGAQFRIVLRVFDGLRERAQRREVERVLRLGPRDGPDRERARSRDPQSHGLPPPRASKPRARRTVGTSTRGLILWSRRSSSI